MRRMAVAVTVALLVGIWAPPAQAASSRVTLSASRGVVTIGDAVRLTGVVTPTTAHEMVVILNATGQRVAHATTDAKGRYAVSFVPVRNVRVHAAWGRALSGPVLLRVHARTHATLGNVRLFDRAEATGWVRPLRPGAHVRVSLIHEGAVVARRWPALGPHGRFATDLPVEQPGWYRVVAAFHAPDLQPGFDDSRAEVTPLPALAIGDDGVAVALLEARLAALRYRIEGIGGSFDGRTADAVVAFHKVQGMDRVRTVTASTWWALADPLFPKPRFARPAFHVEIDQTRQVLYTVRDGAVVSISHVSTGKPSTPTYDGTFSVYRKLKGLVGSLYYPSYFDGNRAIHGYTEVPTYAASHGCIRFPYWNAVWIYRQATIGTVIRIYH